MRRPSIARLLLASSLVLAWWITTLMVTPYRSLPHPVGLARLLPLDALLHPVAWFGLGALHVSAAVAFLLRWREEAAGWLLMASLGLQVTVELSVRQIFMPHLESMLAGDLLLAWLLGRAWGRRTGLSGRALDDHAHEVVAGALGAMLTLAAASKLWASGLGWLDGTTHCAVIYEHALMGTGALSQFRYAVADLTPLCTAGAVYTLVVEGAGVLVVWPRWRRPYAWAVALLFVFLAVFLAIYEHNWATMSLALAYGTLGDPRPEGPHE